MTVYLSHPLILPDTVEKRKYQVNMASVCLKHDTLIILPTGLGKTVVALQVSVEVLSAGKKVLILAPTRPLVNQHNMTFTGWLKDVSVGVMNGNMSPEKRVNVIEENDMIIATPQAISNDLLNERYDLSKFGLIIYDEAHRGVGNYAYVTIAKYNTRAISMGMTASPGSNHKKVLQVCQNLCFTKIEMRSDYDPDVSPYVHDTMIEKTSVKLPEDIIKISDKLRLLLAEYTNELANMGMMDRNRPVTTGYMLQVGNTLQMRMSQGSKSSYIFRGLVAQSISVKILHAIQMAETQGISPLKVYLHRLTDEATSKNGSKSTKELVNRLEFLEVISLAENTKTEHPKISKVMNLVSRSLEENHDSKIMVFAQYRDTCDLLVEKLSGIDGIIVDKLIGQAKGGLKQKEQLELLERFKHGECNIIVSTSVGEEGLDISSTDLVIFYEPVPSEIRTIQRRGRTGRKNDGKVIVLMAENTADEAFDKSSMKKEEQMRDKLHKLNYELEKTVKKPIDKGQMYISNY